LRDIERILLEGVFFYPNLKAINPALLLATNNAPFKEVIYPRDMGRGENSETEGVNNTSLSPEDTKALYTYMSALRHLNQLLGEKGLQENLTDYGMQLENGTMRGVETERRHLRERVQEIDEAVDAFLAARRALSPAIS
jgi:hypothetical protein